jgi:hypothetical protein
MNGSGDSVNGSVLSVKGVFLAVPQKIEMYIRTQWPEVAPSLWEYRKEV